MIEEHNKPVDTIRLGAIKAAIWQNQMETGVRYSATFERLYKDGDQWKQTRSFGRDDLLLLAKVADLTHVRICQLQQEEKLGE